MNIEKFTRLQKQVDELKTKRDRMQGTLDALHGRMVKEFNCETIEELQTKLNSEKETLRILEDKFDDGLRQLEKMVPVSEGE